MPMIGRQRTCRPAAIVRAGFALALLLGGYSAASAAVCDDLGDVCSAPTGPCTITGEKVCDSPVTLDLGGRDLIVATPGTAGTLRASNGDGTGTLEITGAGSITVQDKGTIEGRGESVNVELTSQGPVLLAAGSRVEAAANPDGGSIVIVAESGALEALGQLVATAPPGAFEGTVILSAEAGDVTIGGEGIDVSAKGEDSFGGSIDVDATGDVRIEAKLDLTAWDGGFLFVDAGGSILSSAVIDMSPADLDGGIATLLAEQDVTVEGQILAPAKTTDDFGGIGGDVDILASSGQVQIRAPIDVSGPQPDSVGGSITVAAGTDLVVEAPLLAGGASGDSAGGTNVADVALTSPRVVIASTVDVATGDVGGRIHVFAPTGAVTVQGSLLADGPTTGGRIQVLTCTLDVVTASVLSATGGGLYPNASILLQASGQMTLAGTLAAGDRNLLEYRTLPPLVTGGQITPPEEVVANPALPACGATTTTTTSTTTTSTSSPTSTTTSTTTSPTFLPTTSTSASPTTTASTSTSTTAPGPTSTTTPTTPLASTTTSTTLPLSCREANPPGFDRVDCELQNLSDLLGSESDEALGGPRTAKVLAQRAGKVQRLITLAGSKAKPGRVLGRAKLVLRSLRGLTSRGTRQGRIDPDVGEELLAAIGDLSALIDEWRAASRSSGQP